MEQKRNRKNQILNAALKVFVVKGYSKTTMDDIVSASKLSKGALYHYYKSKKDLFLSLIDHWEVYTFKNFYKKKSENKKYAYIAEVEFWSLSNQDKEIKERSQLLYDKLLNLFERVVKKGIENKEFKDLDIRKTAMMILAIFQGVNWFVIFNEKLISPKEYIESSIEMIINSISRQE